MNNVSHSGMFRVMTWEHSAT